ncbi:hypothetical protein NECID01_2151 [Nematocida sp. AWRm77]|nr:hypothetical protein NECID01_2151 [Nematocida sp. AWRm77]
MFYQKKNKAMFKWIGWMIAVLYMVENCRVVRLNDSFDSDVSSENSESSTTLQENTSNEQLSFSRILRKLKIYISEEENHLNRIELKQTKEMLDEEYKHDNDIIKELFHQLLIKGREEKKISSTDVNAFSQPAKEAIESMGNGIIQVKEVLDANTKLVDTKITPTIETIEKNWETLFQEIQQLDKKYFFFDKTKAPMPENEEQEGIDNFSTFKSSWASLLQNLQGLADDVHNALEGMPSEEDSSKNIASFITKATKLCYFVDFLELLDMYYFRRNGASFFDDESLIEYDLHNLFRASNFKNTAKLREILEKKQMQEPAWGKKTDAVKKNAFKDAQNIYNHFIKEDSSILMNNADFVLHNSAYNTDSEKIEGLLSDIYSQIQTKSNDYPLGIPAKYEDHLYNVLFTLVNRHRKVLDALLKAATMPKDLTEMDIQEMSKLAAPLEEQGYKLHLSQGDKLTENEMLNWVQHAFSLDKKPTVKSLEENNFKSLPRLYKKYQEGEQSGQKGWSYYLTESIANESHKEAVQKLAKTLDGMHQLIWCVILCLRSEAEDLSPWEIYYLEEYTDYLEGGIKVLLARVYEQNLEKAGLSRINLMSVFNKVIAGEGRKIYESEYMDRFKDLHASMFIFDPVSTSNVCKELVSALSRIEPVLDSLPEILPSSVDKLSMFKKQKTDLQSYQTKTMIGGYSIEKKPTDLQAFNTKISNLFKEYYQDDLEVHEKKVELTSDLNPWMDELSRIFSYVRYFIQDKKEMVDKYKKFKKETEDSLKEAKQEINKYLEIEKKFNVLYIENGFKKFANTYKMVLEKLQPSLTSSSNNLTKKYFETPNSTPANENTPTNENTSANKDSNHKSSKGISQGLLAVAIGIPVLLVCGVIAFLVMRKKNAPLE